MQREPLKERARGRWPGILSALGVPAKALKNRHGPCPVCGGKDRFRFDDKGGTGSFICNQCGAGDGIELVKRLRGVEFKEAARLIEAQIGTAPVIATRQNGRAVQDDAARREEMAALWKRSQPITPDDLAGRYLHERTGLTEFPSCLRFAADERYCDPGTKPSWHPALVALVEPSPAADPCAVPALHRTYLHPLGGKADVSSPRKMMGSMPKGAAVRLMPHSDVLGIAEGIETALSASVLFNVPVWAALTAGLLQDWTPPHGVKVVMIFGDHDHSFTGQAAAFALAQRLRAKGITAAVEIPSTPGKDWNDILKEQRS